MKAGSEARKSLFWRLAPLAFYVLGSGAAAESQTVAFQHFPGRESVGILCWSVPEPGAGYLSQIVVLETDKQGNSKLLWQSPLDNSYAAQVRFIPEIIVQGMPLALVERQTGAASSRLDVIGETPAGHITRLFRTDGFRFDVEHLDGGELPFLIAHRDASILDVPDIYRWNGRQFAEDSASHPGYYRQLLIDAEEKIPPDSSGIVMVSLSRIAVLSGDQGAARTILEDALSQERNKGQKANQETLRLISNALQSLGPHPQ